MENNSKERKELNKKLLKNELKKEFKTEYKKASKLDYLEVTVAVLSVLTAGVMSEILNIIFGINSWIIKFVLFCVLGTAFLFLSKQYAMVIKKNNCVFESVTGCIGIIIFVLTCILYIQNFIIADIFALFVFIAILLEVPSIYHLIKIIKGLR
jgi:hypothetical protein